MTGIILGGGLAGLALGMLGAGGTIIGLPMLPYLGGPQGHAAFGTNAFGVTFIALLLLFWRIRGREVDLLPGITFTLPSLVGIAIGARLGLLYPAAKLVLLLSFLILVVAGWVGFLSTRPPVPAPEGSAAIGIREVLRIVPTALVVGLISGFFAIGGGFLVVPGLAIAATIDLRASARSSLVPIAAFAGLDAIEYFLAGDVRLALSGIILSDRLHPDIIQRVFAAFLTIVAVYMIAQHV